MSAISNQAARPRAEEPDAMGERLFRTMCWAVALAVSVSAAFEPWRVTTGLALGGALALLNHHWLRTSVRAAFSGAASRGLRPRLGVARFVLRYLVVVAAVASAYTLGVVSIVATLVGLCAFVVAGLVEGFYQTFSIFIHREES